jgi:hypothetical protein
MRANRRACWVLENTMTCIHQRAMHSLVHIRWIGVTDVVVLTKLFSTSLSFSSPKHRTNISHVKFYATNHLPANTSHNPFSFDNPFNVNTIRTNTCLYMHNEEKVWSLCNC